MKRTVISVAVLSLAVAGVSQAQAAPAVEKVTGGGQITFFPTGEDGEQEEIASGPGSTIAFNAQENADGVKGQIQFVDRPNGPGRPEQVLHATVTCLNVVSSGDEGGLARIGGVANKTGEFVVIDVMDAGEGMDVMDMISVSTEPGAEGSAPNCDAMEDDIMADRGLGRGNVKIHSGGEDTGDDGGDADDEEQAPEGETSTQGGKGKGGK